MGVDVGFLDELIADGHWDVVGQFLKDYGERMARSEQGEFLLMALEDKYMAQLRKKPSNNKEAKRLLQEEY